MKTSNEVKNKSFTLIELLVVISVIGLISSIVLVSLKGGRDKAKIAKAQAEVSTIYKAILAMEAETGEYPRINNIDSLEGWKTYLISYLPTIGKDPWGRAYSYDGCPEPCSSCMGSGWNAGCEDGLWQTSVCSAGPNNQFESPNNPPTGDDVCIYFNGGPSW